MCTVFALVIMNDPVIYDKIGCAYNEAVKEIDIHQTRISTKK
jgi:hypothetical protein